MNKIYNIVKQLLDNRISFKDISKLTGLNESDIIDFYNNDYQYIKTEEQMKALNDYLGNNYAVRCSIYDNPLQKYTR